MAKVSKKVELAPMDKPSLMPEDYADCGSALLRYGQLSAEKSGKLLGDATKLSTVQVQYLNMRMAGLSLVDTCKALCIDTAVPMLWEEEEGKEGVYAHCIAAIRRKQALMLEDSMWQDAVTDSRPSRDAMRMSLIRARMPEYKDNAPSVVMPVQVNISIDREPYAIDTGVTEVIDDEQQG